LPRDVGAIIVAAGRGIRMGGTQPKPFRRVGGIPILARAVGPFLAHPDVAHVVIVLRQSDVAAPPRWLAGLHEERVTLVAGGDERADSVRAGLEALAAECGTVLVHDGARPFVESDLLDAVISAARRGVGAVAGVPLTDTVKQVTDDGGTAVIVETLPRERLWRAQTPQGFPRRMLEDAHRHAAKAGVTGTDDASLVERVGNRVEMVPDSARNIKITTPYDLALAEWLVDHLP
jgi:2-C-methyl-D-erythritol 4-phosphate cytidylyltransferase